MGVRRSASVLLAALALGCSEPEAALPRIAAPPAEPAWPRLPDGLSAEVRGCVDDYRALARDGLPPQTPGVPFATWYRGPFQTWTARYNDVRERCDAVFAALDEASAAAQVMLAAQSAVHERAARDASPLDAEAQMFVLARYWSLGAACTYQSCTRGPDRAFVEHCAARARELPACPPIEPASE